MNKYLLLYRNPVDQPPHSADFQPSEQEMQAMFKQWAEWKQKFAKNMLELGDGLTREGRVLKVDGGVSDGPFVEVKEVLGGFSIIQAENFEEAVEVARGCPVRHMPGNHIEVRELAGFG